MSDDQVRELATIVCDQLDSVGSVALGDLERLKTALADCPPPSTNPDTSQYLLVDREPTKEMVEDGMQAMGYKAEGRPYGGARQRFTKGLRAALAVQQKGEER